MATGQNTSSTKYTKVTIKKSVYELAKQQALKENRSVMNYIENLILVASPDTLKKEIKEKDL